jgi:hypothetical protein
MTPDRHIQPTPPWEDPEAEGERVCAELQAQVAHACEVMDQSRRLLRAVAMEPRSFRRDDD